MILGVELLDQRHIDTFETLATVQPDSLLEGLCLFALIMVYENLFNQGYVRQRPGDQPIQSWCFQYWIGDKA